MLTTQPILIVEHDAAILEICADLLEAEGFATLKATDTEQALSMARQHKPSLAVIEWGLPSTNGGVLCSQLKANPSTASMPVILMSTHQHLAGLAAEVCSADALLAQPFDVDDFVEVVHRLIQRSKLPQVAVA